MIWHFLEVWGLLLVAFAAGCALGTLLYMAVAASPLAGVQASAADSIVDALGGLRLPRFRRGDSAGYPQYPQPVAEAPYVPLPTRHAEADYAVPLIAEREQGDPVAAVGGEPLDEPIEPEWGEAPGPYWDDGLESHEDEPAYESNDGYEAHAEDEAYREYEGYGDYEGYAEHEEHAEPLPPVPPPVPPLEPAILQNDAPAYEPQTPEPEPEPDLPVMRPLTLPGPRNGVPDNLQRIRGIGQKNEELLHGLGIYHFGQIAAWTPAEARWVANHLAFPERIERDDWIGQAIILATGGDTGYVKAADRRKAGEEPPVAA